MHRPYGRTGVRSLSKAIRSGAQRPLNRKSDALPVALPQDNNIIIVYYARKQRQYT